MIIVPLKDVSIEDYVEFKNKSAKESEYINRSSVKQVKELLKREEENKNLLSFLLLDNKEIIGQLFLKLNKKEKTLHILLISVSKSHAKKGYGKKLIDKAVEVAKSNKLEQIELIVRDTNKPAIKFYEKNDFKYKKEYDKKNLVYVKTIINKKPIYHDW